MARHSRKLDAPVLTHKTIITLISHLNHFFSSQSFFQPSPASSYNPTPSPLDYTSPLTPGAITPSPLGSYGTPGSVGSMIDHGMNIEWQTVDIMVKVKQSHDDEALIGKLGVIKSISVSKNLEQNLVDPLLIKSILLRENNSKCLG